MPALLSLCMIVKNEAENLPRCLASVRGVVDEIIVVDTGSTDATPQIAAAAGARVLTQAWRDDFAEARNISLAAASGEWILVLDADEALTPESQTALRPALRTVGADGLWVTVLNLAAANDLVAAYPTPILRLFRNRPGYRYAGRLHEQLTPALQRQGGRLEFSDLTVLHYGYQAAHVQTGDQRSRRNIALLEQAAQAAPHDAYLAAKLGCAYFYAGQAAPARQQLLRFFEAGALPDLHPTVGQEAHLAFATLASVADELEAAAAHGAAALVADGNPALNLKARLVLAMTRLRQGQRLFEAAPEGAPELQRAWGCLAQALQQLEILQAQPALQPAAQAEVAGWLTTTRVFQLTVAAALQTASVALLQRLLAADDLPAALDAHQPDFTPWLVDVIRAEVQAARAHSQTDLADGLESLAAHIAARLPETQPAA